MTQIFSKSTTYLQPGAYPELTFNRGCKIVGALQSIGEGGISVYHQHGGDLVRQIGTGYFGCRNPDGTFSLERFLETVAAANVKMLAIKLSQSAKPGLGGLLPAHKASAEIAAARGVRIVLA